MRTRPRLALLVLVATFAACSSPTGCACTLWQPRAQGSFTGDKLDTAGALRLSADGFRFLNQNSGSILDLFAPGGTLLVAIPCTVQSASVLGNLIIADEGQIYCTAESCGQLDGRCDANDLPHPVTLTVSSLSFAPKSPDVVVAMARATVQTGPIMISSVSRNHALCLLAGGGPLKCSVDFDSARASPFDNQLDLNIKLTIDQKWDRLLALEVSEVEGARACGAIGALPPPACIDGNDIVINTEGACTACSIASFSVVKTLMVDLLAASLKDQLNKAIGGSNCAACGPGGSCPLSPTATATCQVPDAGLPGECVDTATGACVPGLLGSEGRLNIGWGLSSLGAPSSAAIDLHLGAGGSASANDAGVTIGLRGGAKEVVVASCVKPLTRALPAALPLPDFDFEAPGPYDLGLSVSQQFLTEAMFRAQQSGSLCLELGTDQLALFDSSLLGALLPSLNRLTDGKSVPLRAVIRPVNPPTATIGAGTVDVNGNILEPLVRLDWPALEIDVYAMLDERLARLFTVRANVSLPFGVDVQNCDQLTPVIGDVTQAITQVEILNNEILAEPLDALRALVPQLLTFIEPLLAQGFTAFALPELQGFRLDIQAVQGLGPVAGTQNFNHVGIFAGLFPATAACPAPLAPRRQGGTVRLLERRGDTARFDVGTARDVSWRLNGGFWSTWQRPDAVSQLVVRHPALRLPASLLLEVRTRDGAQSRLRLAPGAAGIPATL